MRQSTIRRVGKRARHPFVGLATMLGAIVLFLLCLVAMTALVHWVMM